MSIRGNVPPIATILFALVFASGSLFAQTPPKKKKRVRRPSSVHTNYIDKNGIPRLANGSPDYKRFPNPFIVKKWDLDAEGASGQTADGNGYQQYGLGASAYFYNWLAWRNVAFYRPATQGQGTPLYGLDMSERMSYEFGRSGVAVFTSPGYRFAGPSSAPLADGGLQFRVAGLTFSIGARGYFRGWIQTGGVNDQQVFLNLSTRIAP